MTATWDPFKILHPKIGSNSAVVVLNQPILLDESIFDQIWKTAILHVTVDGGTNRLESYMRDSNCEYVPEVITGDFDSITEEIRTKFIEKGSKVIETKDQSETDFTKSLRVISDRMKQSKNQKFDSVVAICENGGRLDHIMANINTLYKANSIISCPVFMISSDAITWVLNSGNHHIKVPWSNRSNINCSLIPIGQPCRTLNTSGLHWDVENDMLMFGKLISTSNRFDESELVKISTSDPIIFSMEYPKCESSTKVQYLNGKAASD